MTGEPSPAKPRRVVVIGAGIVGIACASYLQRDGHRVTVVDRLSPGEACSKGNAGAFSPGGVVPLAMPGMLRQIPRWLFDPLGPLFIDWRYLPKALPWLLRFIQASDPARVEAIAQALRTLLGDTFGAYATLARAAGCEDLIRRSGYLYVYERKESYAKDARGWGLRRALGVKTEELDVDAIRQLEPTLAPIYETGVFVPEHGYCTNPWRLVQALAEHFSRSGGAILQGEVSDLVLRRGAPSSVATSLGPLETDLIVIAAGAWSAKLAKRVGHRVPLESQRGYHVTIGDPGFMPRIPVSPAEHKVFVTPMEAGLRVAGTVEFKGLKAPPDMRRADALLRHVRRAFPQLKPKGMSIWMGHRPCLPDSLPVIGPSPRHPSVLFAFGHGHLGLTGASTTGRAIADVVAGRTPSFDLTPFRVDRF